MNAPAWPADKVKRRPIGKLLPYARNPREHSPEQVKQLANAISEYGWTMPCLVDEAGVLIAGHGRVLAAEQLGLDTIPVMVAEGWSESRKQAYRIWDNQSALLGTWNVELLSAELRELMEAGENMELVGFPEAELVQFLAGTAGGLAGEDDEDAGEEAPQRELTPEEKALMIKAWQRLGAEWLDIVKAQALLSTNFTKGALAAHFLRARFFGLAIPQAVSLPYNPHRALCVYRSGSLADGLLKATTNEQNFVERLWFVMGSVPRLDKLLGGTLPFFDHRIPGEFPAELAQSLCNEFVTAPGGRVLDPCHGWGGRLLGFMLADNTGLYHGFDTDDRTVAGVKAMFADLKDYAAGKKAVKLECKPFEDSKLAANSFDFAMTSPPYYDTEEYGGAKSSWRKFKTFDQWVEGFYRPLLGKTAKALRKDATFALQVGSQEYPLEKIAREAASSSGLTYVDTRLTEMSAKGHVGFHTEGAIERDRDQHEVVVVLRKG